MKDGAPTVTKLSEYSPLDYRITNVDLVIDLDESATKVLSKMLVSASVENPKGSLYLNGREMELLSVRINGQVLDDESYTLTKNGLNLLNVPQEFTLEIENQINPSTNTELEGLYLSSGMFCTQNEAEGFRKITYFIDRPDNMASYTTKIIGDEKKQPVMLSNGNLVESGQYENGRHWVKWEDPFPKPCYLFALVAGNLSEVNDTFVTKSGRHVDLKIYVDHGNEGKCDHAMESLKNAMKWDEDVYGLEYDLDIYMVVAVDSFNMGAMENKGLNIFNSAYVLANNETATDNDFLGIEAVIGHEYFHNWTGNRVTCRDWFQLTLKEGLTVFRDSEFSADLNSRTVKRIQDVATLRSSQFNEDAGPSSHPIKPSEYIEINNFYTSTIYEKGSEVIRMIHTMLGKDGFRKGMDKYFELYDGMAVTTEDFLNAMSIANKNFDFEQFKLWYSQKGTPEIEVSYQYNYKEKKLALKVLQKPPKTLPRDQWKPYHFPLKLGIISKESGREFELFLGEVNGQDDLERGFLHIRHESEEFIFCDVEEDSLVSLNRDFSAPIILKDNNSFSDKVSLLSKDSNNFNRYEVSQDLAIEVILDLVKADQQGDELNISEEYLESYGKIIHSNDIDISTKALSLARPNYSILFQKQDVVDVSSTYIALEFMKKVVAGRFEKNIFDLYLQTKELTSGNYSLSADSIGARQLKTFCLATLMSLGDEKYEEECFKLFNESKNMTDSFNSLFVLCHYGKKYKDEACTRFYSKWNEQTLVMQKWIQAQATSPSEETLSVISELEGLPVFDIKVPNLVRSLVGSFCFGNPIQFHRPDGEGYKYASSKILELDELNPQMAARIMSSFNIYSKLTSNQKGLMRIELDEIMNKKGLSKNVYEIVSKIVAS